MNCEVVNIELIVRRVRGGSQAYLVQGSDHRFYIAKFAGNPQGTRTLINEWIASHLFRRLELTTPKLVVLRLPPSTKCLGKAPTFETGNLRLAISPGLHLGSPCPVNPEETAIYDFLPSNLIGKTVNLAEFAKVLVLDMFLGQADSRQAVFVRDRSKRELSFRAYFIDHGFAFGGNNWKIDDFARQALYFDQNVYSMIDTGSLCEQAIESLASVSEDELRSLARGIPSEWLSPTDDENLCSLFTTSAETESTHAYSRFRTADLSEPQYSARANDI